MTEPLAQDLQGRGLGSLLCHSRGAAGTMWKELLLRNCLQLGPRSLCGPGKSHSLSGLLYSLFLRGASLRRKGEMENTVEEKARGKLLHLEGEEGKDQRGAAPGTVTSPTPGPGSWLHWRLRPPPGTLGASSVPPTAPTSFFHFPQVSFQPRAPPLRP